MAPGYLYRNRGSHDCDSEGEAVNTAAQTILETPAAAPASPWYALRIRSRHEKVAAEELKKQGIEAYLPLVTQLHQWSDRKKSVEMPLFAGYAFARFEPASADRLRVLRTRGVVGFVGPRWEQTPVPETQILGIRALLAGERKPNEHSYLKVGQRVRIRGGSLDGVEGILSNANGNRSLVITVEPIARSISIRVEGYELDLIETK